MEMGILLSLIPERERVGAFLGLCDSCYTLFPLSELLHCDDFPGVLKQLISPLKRLFRIDTKLPLLAIVHSLDLEVVELPLERGLCGWLLPDGAPGTVVILKVKMEVMTTVSMLITFTKLACFFYLQKLAC